MTTVQSRLNEWKGQLLDLNKRNRLLHFKEAKYQTLRVRLPEPEAVFTRIVIQEKPLTVVGLNQQDVLDLEVAPAEEKKPTSWSSTVNPGEIIFSGSADTIAKALYTLRLRAKTEYEERGVGALYLAFGFLHWFEADQSNYEIVSPLVLVPVDLERDTAPDPYRVILRDDDIVLNSTLSKAVWDQFKIELPDLLDADAWSFPDYLSAVEKRIANQHRWRITETVYLSAFSFLKLNMYRDLESNLTTAENNSIIQALAGNLSLLVSAQGNISEIPARELDDRVNPTDCLQVLDADSSQQQAIELAKSGASFVLQGPPGTGKSQTIANIIAELIGLGRTVLFVSEKAAALDVVYRRLASAGLSDGCLALHSYKANKRDVVSELERVYSKTNSLSPESASFNYSRLSERRSALNAYARELHARRKPFDKSVFEVESWVAKLADAPQVPFEITNVTQLTSDQFELMRGAITHLAESHSAIVNLRENPWRGASIDGQSVELRRVTLDHLSKVIQLHSLAHEAGTALAEALGVDASDLTPAWVEKMVKIGLDIADGPKFMSSWLARERLGDLIQLAQTASEQYGAVATENAIVSAVFSDSVLQYDLDGLAGRLKGKYRWFFARFGGAYRQECQGLSQFTNTGKRPKFSELKRAIPAALNLRGRQEWIASQESTLREQFGPWYSGYETDWVALKEALAWTHRISKHFSSSPPEEFVAQLDDLLANQGPLRLAAENTDHCVSSARAGMQEINEWFVKDAPARAILKRYESTPLADSRAYASHLNQAIDDLASWTRLIRAAQSCTETGVTNPIQLLQTTDIVANEYVRALESRVLTLWLDHWIGKVPVLRDFEAASHAHRIDEFRRLDMEQQHAARRALAARLAERRPHPSAAAMNLASSQPALLMKEAKKKRRHKPLRRLFAEIPDLLIKIKPCMMMSPLSVSQFLPVESLRFDAVIFDEASQVKPEDAIGAIMRGRQIIVVGDNKQLPPTTFFDVSMTDDLDEDDYYENDTGAFESILDLCGTIGLPERMLQWHYRSRREGLIAFSNKFLYNNGLVTFPAPDFDGTDTGVEFRYMTDGVYDRSRSRKNDREVQEILNIIKSHAREYPNKSLGVVTFSQAQMTAIDMALWRLRSKEPTLESFFTNMRDEPFFVKNLENVQGDERDVMVFSVGYGRDAAGKFTMNFGPLNKTGGERRLNVAVTRAREKVILVSSIRGSDIDVSRSQAQGVQLLKHYLDYAERGLVVLDAVPTINRDAASESAFEDEVARVIENLGYRVDKQVGCSGYRIDLAIVDPAHPGRYALGIECDGASYHSAATARERDRLREQVLTNLGWKLYRIWSTDWFRTRPREIDRLKTAINDAIAAPKTGPFEAIQLFNAPEKPRQNLPSSASSALSAPTADDRLLTLASPYVESRPAKQTGNFYTEFAKVKQVLVRVVKEEGPIHLDVATRRVASAWDIERAAHRVQEVVKFAQQAAVRERLIISRGDFLYNPHEDKIRVRRNSQDGATRKIAEIAPEEIAEAARLILTDQIKLTRDDLISATARLLGFERTGTEIKKVIPEGIRVLVNSGAAVEVDGNVSLV